MLCYRGLVVQFFLLTARSLPITTMSTIILLNG